MRRASLVVAMIFLTWILTSAASAQLNRFAGRWTNVDPNTRGITALEVAIRRSAVMVQAWGKCTPADCDWGGAEAYPYGPSVSADMAAQAQALTALFPTGFGQTLLVMRPEGRDRLRVEAFTRFTDGSGRSNYVDTYVLSQGAGAGGPVRVRPTTPGPVRVRLATPGTVSWPVIHADGSIEVRYPDGTVKIYQRGGITIIRPDGQRATLSYVQIPAPPWPPNDVQMANWLSAHNNGLHNTIRALLSERPDLVERYGEKERQEAKGNVYAQMGLRREFIDILVSVLRP